MTRYGGPAVVRTAGDRSPAGRGLRPGSLSQCNQTPPRQRATLCHGLYLQHLAAGLGTALYV